MSHCLPPDLSPEAARAFSGNALKPRHLCVQDLLGLPRQESELAVYWSAPSVDDRPQWDQLSSADRTLRRLGFTVDTIVSGSAGFYLEKLAPTSTLAAYRALVVAGASGLGDDQIQTLLDYAAGGGHLVVLGEAGRRALYTAPPEATTIRQTWSTLLSSDGTKLQGSGKVTVLRFATPLLDDPSTTELDESGWDVEAALHATWGDARTKRPALASWLGARLELAGIVPALGRLGDEVHVTKQTDADRTRAVYHLLNYGMKGRAGTETYSEKAGVCEQRAVVLADAVPVTTGALALPVPAAVKSAGGRARLVRLGSPDFLAPVAAGTTTLGLTLTGSQVCLGSTCAALDGGLKTWWLVAIEPAP